MDPSVEDSNGVRVGRMDEVHDTMPRISCSTLSTRSARGTGSLDIGWVETSFAAVAGNRESERLDSSQSSPLPSPSPLSLCSASEVSDCVGSEDVQLAISPASTSSTRDRNSVSPVGTGETTLGLALVISSTTSSEGKYAYPTEMPNKDAESSLSTVLVPPLPADRFTLSI